jgi:hypothetical protein
MMTCQTYIFKLTSGQLDEAGWVERLGAAQHRLVCRHCRAFTKNDEALQVLLRRYREDVAAVDQVLDP